MRTLREKKNISHLITDIHRTRKEIRQVKHQEEERDDDINAVPVMDISFPDVVHSIFETQFLLTETRDNQNK